MGNEAPPGFIGECVKKMKTVERPVSLFDPVFLNRSEQRIERRTESSVTARSGRKEHQLHLPFSFQWFYCFTLVQMGTCKKPQDLVCN